MSGRFFERFDGIGVLGVVLRPRRELAKPHGAQFPHQRGATDQDVKLLPNPLDQIDQTPANHTVQILLGASIDGGGQPLALLSRQD